MIDVRDIGLGLREVRVRRFGDERGFFSETWNAATWAAAGLDLSFVQDNHSLSAEAGTVRGLHYQLPPTAQVKLVRVSRGSVFDVAVDVRRSSPTFGQWVGLTLSSREWNQLLVPEGFAHGFMTLEPDTEVQYKVSAPYEAADERVVRFDDPVIGIDWPDLGRAPVLSDKDRRAPFLADAEVFA